MTGLMDRKNGDYIKRLQFAHGLLTAVSGLPAPRWRLLLPGPLLAACLGLSACDDPQEAKFNQTDKQAEQCDPDNGSLILPDGFCAKVVADNLGSIRHITVDSDGDIYAAMRNLRYGLGGILGLRDTDGDGRMDVVKEFAEAPGLEIDIYKDWLYFGADEAIYRYKLGESLIPEAAPETVVNGFPEQDEHSGKSFAFDNRGHLYVNVGAPSNACQNEDRKQGVLGWDPCPELERHAGIWQFSATETGQQQSDGRHYASGIRNAYAIDWSDAADSLYIVQHGRDQLHELWPQYYSVVEGAEQPSEQMLRVQPDTAYSWPYCYHDYHKQQLVLAPEYGGDGEKVGRCADFPEPLLGFPAHYGPNDMLFYEAGQFPQAYHNGAFIAFHGSYNRGDLEQVGYQVVFVPFSGGSPAGDWRVFADGFAADGGSVQSPDEAEFRPTGLAVGPSGSLYVSDSVQGRIWRIRHIGSQQSSAEN